MENRADSTELPTAYELGEDEAQIKRFNRIVFIVFVCALVGVGIGGYVIGYQAAVSDFKGSATDAIEEVDRILEGLDQLQDDLDAEGE